MIDNTLAIRMAERLENITTVCKNTGISRTTLTSIYHKRCKHRCTRGTNEIK